MSDLWPKYTLGELVLKVGSGATPKGGEAVYKPYGTPLIRSMNVVFFDFKRDGLAFIDDTQATNLKNAEVKSQDVLLNITGASIGRVTMAPKDMNGARVNQHVCIIRPTEVLDNRFLNAYLSSPSMQAQIWSDNYGVTRQALTKQQILDFEIPLPPLNEQKRIADKLDAVLSRVNACRDRLDRIPTILKHFRQSVLAAATQGKLTEDWREQLSKQFLWGSRKVSDIAQVIDPHPSHRTPPEFEDGVPYISIGDINSNGEIDFDGARKVSHDVLKEHQARYKINSGDFIFGKIGTIGKPTKLPTDRAYTISANVLLIQADNDFVTGEYLRIIFSSPAFMATVTENSAATSQSAFGIKKMRDARVQLPDISEQAEIVRRVESLFAYADRLETRYYAARSQVEKLTPSLLAKAFRGELVPQDPNDEPASELLERIAAAKSEVQPKKRTGRQRKSQQQAEANVDETINVA